MPAALQSLCRNGGTQEYVALACACRKRPLCDVGLGRLGHDAIPSVLADRRHCACRAGYFATQIPFKDQSSGPRTL